MIFARETQTAAAVAGHYDELDPFYREIWGEHVHHGLFRSGRESVAAATLALSDLVGDRLAVAPGDALVDIGCGYGGTARHFAATRQANVTGITLSARQAAAAPPAEGVAIRVADWLDNGLSDAAFDGAYAIESSEHIADKPRFFAEARRVLRPGGRLAVAAWLTRAAPGRWETRHLLEPICREGRMPSMGSEADYRAMAEAAGFRLERFDDLSDAVARTWSIILARVAHRLVTDRRYRAFLRDARAGNRVFALSLPRLRLAYATGAMRYGLFLFERN